MTVNETDPAEFVRLSGSVKNSSSIGSDGVPSPNYHCEINN